MKKFALLLIALCCSPALMACEAFLIGTWQSDGATTMAFNRANAKLENRQDRFLTSLMGKMTIEFTATQLHLRMPATEVMVKDELKPFEGFEERNTYKTLFCNERMAVLQTTDAITGENRVTTYFFAGADAIWAYIGTSDPKMPDLHIREYFKRLQ